MSITSTHDTADLDLRLAGRRVLISGADGERGGELVTACAEDGARVLIQHHATGPALAAGLASARRIGHGVRAFGCSLGSGAATDNSAVTRLVSTAACAFAGLDAVVAFADQPPADTSATLDPWDAAVDAFTTACHVARSAASVMAEHDAGGSVVVVDAARLLRDAERGLRRTVLEAVVNGLAAEFGDQNVRVYGIDAATLATEPLLPEVLPILATMLIGRDDGLMHGQVLVPDPGAGAADQRLRLSRHQTRRTRPAAGS